MIPAPTYILYKRPVQHDMLAIVQYLHSLGLHLLPTTCIERNYPGWVTDLPSIETPTAKYTGMSQCVQYLESVSCIDNLMISAVAFKLLNPDYRIHN